MGGWAAFIPQTLSGKGPSAPFSTQQPLVRMGHLHGILKPKVFYIGSVTLSLGSHRHRPHCAVQSGLTLMAVLPQLPECWYCRTEHHALLLGHHSMQLLVSVEFLLPWCLLLVGMDCYRSKNDLSVKSRGCLSSCPSTN